MAQSDIVDPLNTMISQFQNGLQQATKAILYSIQNFSSNISFKGGCSDWGSLPGNASAPGDCFYIHSTNEVAIWDGTRWLAMSSIPDYEPNLEWHDLPGTFSSPDWPGKPKSEEEKLNDLADALTLLALS